MPRKKSTPSLVPCVSARPQSGEGQLLCQERSQRLPWCLVSAPAPRVERDSCYAKKEVNAFLGALCQRPPPEWRGTAATAAMPARKKSTPSLVPCVSTRPQSGEGQLLRQERSQCLPWCLVSAPAPKVERDSCYVKKEAHVVKRSSLCDIAVTWLWKQFVNDVLRSRRHVIVRFYVTTVTSFVGKPCRAKLCGTNLSTKRLPPPLLNVESIFADCLARPALSQQWPLTEPLWYNIHLRRSFRRLSFITF